METILIALVPVIWTAISPIVTAVTKKLAKKIVANVPPNVTPVIGSAASAIAGAIATAVDPSGVGAALTGDPNGSALIGAEMGAVFGLAGTGLHQALRANRYHKKK